jgi:hypothetical protein
MDAGTPLTESQARALALWWCGTYRDLGEDFGTRGGSRHGVTLACFPEPMWSREQAQAVEQTRSEVNPAAQDWVG